MLIFWGLIIPQKIDLYMKQTQLSFKKIHLNILQLQIEYVLIC